VEVEVGMGEPERHFVVVNWFRELRERLGG